MHLKTGELKKKEKKKGCVCVCVPTHFTELEGRVKLVTSGQQKHSVVYTRVQRGLRFKPSPEPIGGKKFDRSSCHHFLYNLFNN